MENSEVQNLPIQGPPSGRIARWGLDVAGLRRDVLQRDPQLIFYTLQ